jgi:hypothetical protein
MKGAGKIKELETTMIALYSSNKAFIRNMHF